MTYQTGSGPFPRGARVHVIDRGVGTILRTSGEYDAHGEHRGVPVDLGSVVVYEVRLDDGQVIGVADRDGFLTPVDWGGQLAA